MRPLEIKRAERLVEQQHPRPVHDRAGECDALALPAGELRRLAPGDLRQAHGLQRLPGARRPLCLCDLLDTQSVGHVVEDRHVGEQRVVLEDRVDVALERRPARDVFASELHPPRVRTLESGDQPQRRRLPRSGRSEHREELPTPDLEIDVVHRGEVPEPLREADQTDVRSAGLRTRGVVAVSQARSISAPPMKRQGKKYQIPVRRVVRIGARGDRYPSTTYDDRS
jgi:hypothetical protein